MTKKTRKNFGSDFKAKMALEAIQGVKTLHEQAGYQLKFSNFLSTGCGKLHFNGIR